MLLNIEVNRIVYRFSESLYALLVTLLRFGKRSSFDVDMSDATRSHHFAVPLLQLLNHANH